MKVLAFIMVFGLLAGCSIPKNPSLSFGKKCNVGEGQVTYSYVWLYDKELGLKANAEDCEQIQKKD